MSRMLLRSRILMLGLLAFLAGCANMMNGDHQSVTIFSDPPDAKVTIDEFLHVTAPGTASLSRKADHVALLEKAGYEPSTIKIERTWSWWVVGDITCLLWVYSCIHADLNDGGYYIFADDIHVKLTPRAPAEPSRPQSP